MNTGNCYSFVPYEKTIEMNNKVKIFAAFAVLFLVSCQKDYQCDCVTTTMTTTDTWDDFFQEWTTETTTTTSQNSYTFKSKKGDAQATCDANESPIETLDVSIVTVCTLN